jgi:hypothetical protein
MQVVEVRCSGDELAAPMNQMRTWLDGRHIEPAVFRLSIIPKGTIFRVEFRAASEARAFARALGGKVISEPGNRRLAA